MAVDLKVGEAFLTESFEDRFYLTGFSGTDGLVLVGEKTYLIVDSRYFIQAERQAFPSIEVIRLKTSFLDSLRTLILQKKIAALYFEPTQLSVARYRLLQKHVPCRLLAKRGFVSKQRIIKSKAEVGWLKEAQRLTDAAFVAILSAIKLGQTERDVAWLLEKYIREHGGTVAWEPFIVGFGEHTASPHHNPSKRELTKGDLIQLDFGATVAGYCADMSRVIFTSPPTKRQSTLYNHLLAGQELGIALIKNNQRAAPIDAEVRAFLATKKVGGIYQHGLGHGVGLEIHEGPALSVRSSDVLKTGMVTTVEPGIYIEGWGGMRLEDEVLVTAHGGENLTSAPKNLAAVTIVL